MWALIALGWAAALLVFLTFIVALCRAAARGDQMIDRSLSGASRAEINCDQTVARLERTISSALYPTAVRSAVAVTKTAPASLAMTGGQTLRGEISNEPHEA
jgi:hypothetical protein